MAYKVVAGKVTNEKGDGLAGVSVVVKGTAKGTSTNLDGEFFDQRRSGRNPPVFSMVGYKQFTAVVGQENEMPATLQAEMVNMNEVIIVGYGTQRRSTLTGAISSVSGKTLAELPVASVEGALQGRVSRSHRNQ